MMLKHSIKQCNITWHVHQNQHRINLLKLVYRRTQLLSCFLNICWSFTINVRQMSVFRDKNRWKYLHSCRHFATTQRHSETRDKSCAFHQRWGKPGSQFSRKTSLDIEKGCVLYMTECAYTFDYFEIRGHHGCVRMEVGFTTTYTISAYHHWCCKFESWSERGVQHYVIKFVSDLRQVSGFHPSPPVFSTNKTDHHNITEILLKVSLNTIKQTSNIRLHK